MGKSEEVKRWTSKRKSTLLLRISIDQALGEVCDSSTRTIML